MCFQNGSLVRQSVNFTLNELSNFTYSAYCSLERSVIELHFANDWHLEFYFYKSKATFLFNHVVLFYKFAGPLFPRSAHNGAQSEVYDFAFINSSLTRPYVCITGVSMRLGDVTLVMRNLRVEPFFLSGLNRRPAASGGAGSGSQQQPSLGPAQPMVFDSEVLCANDMRLLMAESADAVPTWIIALSVVAAVLFAVVCLVFVVLRVVSEDAEEQRQERRQNKKDYRNI